MCICLVQWRQKCRLVNQAANPNRAAFLTSIRFQTVSDPPFSEDISNLASSASSVPSPHSSRLDDLLPASIRNEDNLEPPNMACLDNELNPRRLTKIYDYLWLAGLPMPPRPLHYQRAASREIVIVERIDMHLVWEPNKIYIKPLPRYLLSHKFWRENLVCKPTCSCASSTTTSGTDPSNKTPSAGKPHPQPSSSLDYKQQCMGQVSERICLQHQLYDCAYGFLSSYAALIQYESDFRIAQSVFLLPETVTWTIWRELVRQILDEKNRKHLPNKRFFFGELRLNRLNMIYRIRLGNLRGYRLVYQTYGSFFVDNLAPIVSIVTYVVVVLTAMQVGLGTDRLGRNDIFQGASYGFTIFSILFPPFFIAMAFCWFFTVFVSNIFATLSFKKRLTHTHRSLSSV